MRGSPLDEFVKFLEEDITAELEAENLASWVLNACNKDLTVIFQEFTDDELEAIKEEILDGNRATLSIDISDLLLDQLETLTSDSEDSEDSEDEYEQTDEDEDEDQDEDY